MFQRITEFKNNCKSFSLKYAFQIFFARLFNGNKKNKLFLSANYDYLKRHVYDRLNHNFDANEKGQKGTEPIKIWIFWWQGESKMPEIVKICYNSLKHNAKDAELIFLDQNNLFDYVKIPDFVLNKFNKGIITITHLSDIIRIKLLKEYGGIWYDATILTHRPISSDILDMGLRVIRVPENDIYISKGKWSSFFLGAQKSHPLFIYLDQFLSIYWKKYDKQIDYLLIDYAIALGYNDQINKVIKEEIDSGAIFIPNLYLLQNNLNNKFTTEIKDYIKETCFSKLTWKGNFVEKSDKGECTVYGFLKEKFGN